MKGKEKTYSKKLRVTHKKYYVEIAKSKVYSKSSINKVLIEYVLTIFGIT